MTILVINSGLGNVGSVGSILRRIGVSARIIDRPEAVTDGDKVILPGVGAFDAGMLALKERGFDGFVRDAAANGTSILGICLGMQLLCRGSEEGETAGLGLIPADVRKLDPGNDKLRLPHMGWSEAHPTRASRLFDRRPAEPPRFYFVHSYRVCCDDEADVTATTDYGSPFTCAFERGNIAGVQFHPEKSHRFGMDLLRRFAEAS